MNSMKYIAVLLFAFGGFLRADEDTFALKDLDGLVENSAPQGVGTVELLPLPKIRFVATVVAPPIPRKSFYLLNVLQSWQVSPLPRVEHGIALRSPSGAVVNVYLEKAVAQRATRSLAAGSSVMMYGYLVYNSKHGPGILVSDFKADGQ